MSGASPGEGTGATDEALMAAARAGDVEAFGSLVRRFQDRVFSVALRLTRNRQTAEDAAQQAFLQAWQARRTESPCSPTSAARTSRFADGVTAFGSTHL